MHFKLRILISLILMFSASYVSYAGDLGEHPLYGTWQSNKTESVKALRKAGFSLEEIRKLEFLFGQMQVEISKDSYTTNLNGQTQQSSYSLISSENNCYKIKIAQETQQLCIVNNLLYVPSYKGSVEVFDRIE